MLPRKYTKVIHSITLESLIIALTINTLLASCATSRNTDSEILIALKAEAIPLLSQPLEPDPAQTVIPSLDSLNRKWNVQRMVRVFPEISPGDEVAARHGLAGIYKLLVPEGLI